MKAEISQLGLHREQRFTGVYQQQGRMLVDRDWNELCEILRDLATGVSAEAIGTGVPRHGGLLQGPAPKLTLRPEGGLVAAAGAIGRVAPRARPAGSAIYQNQLDLPDQVRGQPLLRGSPEKALLYVDVWERTVTAFESDQVVAGSLIDPALHGADTCFRQQRMVQIKAATADDLDAKADPCLPRFLAERIPAKGNALFTASLTKAGEAADPCDPCGTEVSIVRSVSNHLFRLEVHSVDFDDRRQPKGLQLKWSRDNGAREMRASEVAGAGDLTGHSYEYFSDATERLLGIPSDDWAHEEILRGALDPVDPGILFAQLPRAREWDGWCTVSRNGTDWKVVEARYLGKKSDGPGALMTVSATGGKLSIALIDSGFTFSLKLTGSSFLAGDYWLALVRARAPADQRVRVVSQTPLGVEHRYCILGVNSGTAEKMSFPSLSPYDLRRLQHPSLTCLDAADIGYTADCPSGLFDKSHDTVKKALDQICRISADQVAFKQPCKTSVYSQPSAAKIKTVADALALLCSVSAEQVGYKPQCKTSIFSQPAAQKVETVADALALLCDVSAEQIGFKPECSYLAGFPGKVNTVKQALEALCVQPASAIPFDPQCEYLKGEKVKDVAAALEALCRRGQGTQGLPLIAKTSWTNDAPLPVSQLRKGLTVVFSDNIAGDLLSTDVFIVTWEVPLALPSRVADLVMTEFLTPQIMIGTVELAGPREAVFKPTLVNTDVSFGRLLDNLAQFPKLDFPGVRCRVRLIGRAIFDEEGKRPLDGYVPMRPIREPRGARLDLDFADAGLGQPSDFESWFYLIKG